MSEWEYHYSKGHKGAIIAIVVLAIVIAGISLAYFAATNSTNQLSDYVNTIPSDVQKQVENKTKCPEFENPQCINGTIKQGELLPDGCRAIPKCECPSDRYFENGTCVLNITTNQTNGTQIVNQTNETNATQNITSQPITTSNGLTAAYYNTINLTGNAIAGTVPNLDLSWSSSNPPAEGVSWNRFSARFTGTLRIEKEGDYTFILTSDDGSRLFLDGTNIADLWDSTGVNSKSTFRKMTAGDHTIKVEYRNIGGGAAKLKLEYWASAINISRQIIPSQYFKP